MTCKVERCDSLALNKGILWCIRINHREQFPSCHRGDFIAAVCGKSSEIILLRVHPRERRMEILKSIDTDHNKTIRRIVWNRDFVLGDGPIVSPVNLNQPYPSESVSSISLTQNSVTLPVNLSDNHIVDHDKTDDAFNLRQNRINNRTRNTGGSENNELIASIRGSLIECNTIVACASFDASCSVYMFDVHRNHFFRIAVLRGHESEVKGIDILNTLIVTCSRDRSIWVYKLNNVPNYNIICSEESAMNRNSISTRDIGEYSSDEEGDEAEVECLAILQDHTQDIKNVVFHPSHEGNTFVSASYDSTSKIWERLDTGEPDNDGDWTCVQTINHSKGDDPPNTVWCLKFISGFLFSGTGDGCVRVFSEFERAVINLERSRSTDSVVQEFRRLLRKSPDGISRRASNDLLSNLLFSRLLSGITVPAYIYGRLPSESVDHLTHEVENPRFSEIYTKRVIPEVLVPNPKADAKQGDPYIKPLIPIYDIDVTREFAVDDSTFSFIVAFACADYKIRVYRANYVNTEFTFSDEFPCIDEMGTEIKSSHSGEVNTVAVIPVRNDDQKIEIFILTGGDDETVNLWCLK